MNATLSQPEAVAEPCSDVPVMRLSIHSDSWHEIDVYKWIESERHGYDLGEVAVRRWVERHWQGYLRARWLEHMEGFRFWIELDRGDYGLLRKAFHDEQELLHRIVEQLKAGKENLEVLCWAEANHIPTEPVVRILVALDINARRLRHRFDCVA